MVDATSDPLLGTVVGGRYQIERRLGMGGMGAVYLAVQQPLGLKVALKVLKQNLVGDPVAIERFKNEAKVIAAVGHPHIVGVHDFGSGDDGTLFIAMEYLRGTSLSDLLKNQRALPWARALPIVRDVARALAAAHRRGVVHRDLKPDNVFLVEDEDVRPDYVKVLDFGIAKLVRSEEHAQSLTGTGFVPGTPGYIAPEQIMGDGGDARADLYALGVTWFEMLAGRRPFLGDSAMKLFLAHLNDPCPAVRDVNPAADVPEPIQELLFALLDKDPARRLGSADALLARFEELARFGIDCPGGTTPSSGSAVRLADLPPDGRTMSAAATPVSATRFGASPALDAGPPATTPARAVAQVGGTPASGTSPVGTPSTGTAATAMVQATVGWSRAKRVKVWAATGASFVLVVALSVAFFAYNKQVLRAASTATGVVHFLVRSQDPEVFDGLRAVQRAYYDGDITGAQRLLERVFAKAPDEPAAHLFRGLLDSTDKGSLQGVMALMEAERRLTDHERAHDEGARLITFAAAAAENTGATVKQAWSECGDACQRSLLAHIIAANLLANESCGHYDDALAHLDHADDLVRRSWEMQEQAPALVHILRARAFQSKGMVERAVAAIEAGLKTDPTSVPLLLEGAATQMSAGQLTAARRSIEEAATRAPGNLAAALMLAHVHLLDGNEPARVRIVQGLTATAPPPVLAMIAAEHGAALLGAGRLDDAFSLFTEALEKNLGDCAPQGIMAASDVLMVATRGLATTGDFQRFPRIRERAERLARCPSAPPPMVRLWDGVLKMGDAIIAAQRGGDLGRAREVLGELERPASGVPYFPAKAEDGILAHLRYWVALLQKTPESLAVAEKQAAHHERYCTIRAQTARAAWVAGDSARGDTIVDELWDRRAFCLRSDFQGAALLDALTARAQARAGRGDVDSARRDARAVRQLFRAGSDDGIDADHPFLRRLDGLVPEPATP